MSLIVNPSLPVSYFVSLCSYPLLFAPQSMCAIFSCISTRKDDRYFFPSMFNSEKQQAMFGQAKPVTIAPRISLLTLHFTQYIFAALSDADVSPSLVQSQTVQTCKSWTQLSSLPSSVTIAIVYFISLVNQMLAFLKPLWMLIWLWFMLMLTLTLQNLKCIQRNLNKIQRNAVILFPITNVPMDFI